MKRNYVILTGIALLAACLLVTCGKKQEQQTAEISQTEGAIDSQFVQTIKPKSINYDSMLTVIAPMIETVMQSPTDVQARQQLVAVCFDTTWETILAAGFGKPLQQASTETIAAKYAEQAATADAYRWAAYIKKWHANPSQQDFGHISAEISGGRVVARKDLADQRVSVLVEIRSSDLPD
ncbi:MAG: hypothetical protein ACOY90_09535 [Candidatus Zhuqueibacterota bacterium]